MAEPPYHWAQAFEAWQTVPPVTCVGPLSDEAAHRLMVPTTERTVWIHRETIRHIHRSRGHQSPRVRSVLQAIPEVITTPDYVGWDRTAARTTLHPVPALAGVHHTV